MISSLYNGMSGLDSFQKALNVESNNIANVNTVGYKSDRISFSDMIYESDIGMGTNIQSVDKDFSTGNFKQTGNGYDVAINGEGFFIVENPTTGEIFYTRAGDFKQDVNGNLVTAGGLNVQGSQATVTGDVIDTQLHTQFIASQIIQSGTNINTINAKATDYINSATDDIDPITGRVIKSKESKIADIEALIGEYQKALASYSKSQEAGTASTNQTTTVDFANYATQLTKEGDIVTINVDGKTFSQEFKDDAQTTMELLAEQISSSTGVKDATFDPASGQFTINTLIPGENIKIDGAVINDVAATVTSVEAVKGSGLAEVENVLASLEEALNSADAQLAINTTTVNTAPNPGQALGQVGDINLNLVNLGISTDQFSKPEIIDGVIYMSQGDNKYAIGRIQTAEFIDVNSLEPEGGNLFSETTASGEPLDGTNNNKLIGHTLELSNADLSENLVNLMVFQRAYEANSKSVTTSDEFLNIAIQLKR